MPGSRTLRCIALSAATAAVALTASGCSGGSSKPTADASTSASPSPSDTGFTVKVPQDLGNNASKDTLAKYIGFNKTKAEKALRYLHGLSWVVSAKYIESKGEIDVVYKKGTSLNQVVDTQTRINQM